MRWSRAEYSTRVDRYLTSDRLVSGFAFASFGDQIPACREDWIEGVLDRLDIESSPDDAKRYREGRQCDELWPHAWRRGELHQEELWDTALARTCPEYWRARQRRLGTSTEEFAECERMAALALQGRLHA